MADFEEVPAHLQTHKASAKEPVDVQVEDQTRGMEVPAEKIPAVQAKPEIAPEERLLSPEIAGAGLGTMTGAGALTAQKLHALKNVLMPSGKASLQTYSNSQIGNRYNVPLKELQTLAGMEHPITTPTMVQQAVKNISGSEAIPASREPVFGLDRKGNKVVKYYNTIPEVPARAPVDLSMYEKPTGVKAVAPFIKKQSEVPLRAGVAGYDIGAGLENLSRGDVATGGAQIGAGALMGAAPLAKGKVKAAMTGLGSLPIVGHALKSAIGSAEAAPMRPEEKASMVAELLSSLIPGPVGAATAMFKPTELGSGDVYAGRQGTNPLAGSGSVMENYVPRKADGGRILAPHEEHMQKMARGGKVK